MSTAVELILGAVAGALAQIFTIPVSVIATRQQIGRDKNDDAIQASSSAQNALHDDSFLGVAREIIQEDGVGGLWLGLKPSLVLTVNPAITYGMFERIKGAVLRSGNKAKLSAWEAFAVGALSKTLATVVCLTHTSVRLQASLLIYSSALKGHLPLYHGESPDTSSPGIRRASIANTRSNTSHPRNIKGFQERGKAERCGGPAYKSLEGGRVGRMVPSGLLPDQLSLVFI